MKKMLLSLTTCVIMATLVHAQTEKGDWLVGGLFQLNTAKTNTHIGLTPMGGKFVIKNLAVGADLNFDYSKSGTDKVTQFGIGPFARYYFLNNKVRPIIQVDDGPDLKQGHRLFVYQQRHQLFPRRRPGPWRT